MNWYAEVTTFEPALRGGQTNTDWGSECVEYRYASTPNSYEKAVTPFPYFRPEAIEAAEQSGKILRLFPHDQSYASARAEIENV